MKKYIFIITAVIVSSCNNSKKTDSENQKTIKKELRFFFDSDEIEHFYLNLIEREFEHSVNENAEEVQKKKGIFCFFILGLSRQYSKKRF